MTEFGGAKSIVTFFKVLALLGLVVAICVPIGASVTGGSMSGLSIALAAAPIAVSFAILFVFCEMAMAVFVSAEVAQSEAKAADSRHKELLDGLGKLAPHQNARPADTSAPASAEENRSPRDPQPQPVTPAPTVLEDYLGHRIYATTGRRVRVGSETFDTLGLAKKAIDTGRLD